MPLVQGPRHSCGHPLLAPGSPDDGQDVYVPGNSALEACGGGPVNSRAPWRQWRHACPPPVGIGRRSRKGPRGRWCISLPANWRWSHGCNGVITAPSYHICKSSRHFWPGAKPLHGQTENRDDEKAVHAPSGKDGLTNTTGVTKR
jgi:hypothetical protein